LKEYKAKHQSPASASSSYRRRSEGERITKSSSKTEHSYRKPAIQPPRQSLPSRKKSHSDSDSSSSSSEFLQNEPTYFSTYDKVKARSLKLQQQKRQEKVRKTVQQQ
jgi:hypothetical protein